MAIVPAVIEGNVIGLPTLVGGSVQMNVVGVRVVVPRMTPDPDTQVPVLTPVRTPVRQISLEELADPRAVDGRPKPGFDGGSAIVEGNFDTATGVLTATSVDIEPAENLLLGAITSMSPFTINKVEVHGIIDSRMKFEAYKNEFGFKVALVPALLDKPGTAEGYFEGGIFYAHSIELDSSAPVLPGQPPVSITRAKTRRRPGGPATTDIRGGVDFSVLGGGTVFQVAIRRVDKDPATGSELPDILIGIQRATPDPEFPRFGLWRLKGPLNQPPEGQAAGEPFPFTAPRKIRVYPSLPGTIPGPSQIAEEDADVRF